MKSGRTKPYHEQTVSEPRNESSSIMMEILDPKIKKEISSQKSIKRKLTQDKSFHHIVQTKLKTMSFIHRLKNHTKIQDSQNE
jgi:hypothetical protein